MELYADELLPGDVVLINYLGMGNRWVCIQSVVRGKPGPHGTYSLQCMGIDPDGKPFTWTWYQHARISLQRRTEDMPL